MANGKVFGKTIGNGVPATHFSVLFPIDCKIVEIMDFIVKYLQFSYRLETEKQRFPEK